MHQGMQPIQRLEYGQGASWERQQLGLQGHMHGEQSLSIDRTAPAIYHGPACRQTKMARLEVWIEMPHPDRTKWSLISLHKGLETLLGPTIARLE